VPGSFSGCSYLKLMDFACRYFKIEITSALMIYFTSVVEDFIFISIVDTMGTTLN
jgi:hypothetical protein